MFWKKKQEQPDKKQLRESYFLNIRVCLERFDREGIESFLLNFPQENFRTTKQFNNGHLDPKTFSILSELTNSTVKNYPLTVIVFIICFGNSWDNRENKQIKFFDAFAFCLDVSTTFIQELNNPAFLPLIEAHAMSSYKEIILKRVMICSKEELQKLNKKALAGIETIALDFYNYKYIQNLESSLVSFEKHWKIFKLKEHWEDSHIRVMVHFCRLHPKESFEKINDYSFGKYPIPDSVVHYWLTKHHGFNDEKFIKQIQSLISKYPKKLLNFDENILFYACRLGDIELYSLIAELHPELINQKNKYFFVPLNIAQSNNHLKLVEFAKEKYKAELIPSKIDNLTDDVFIHILLFLTDLSEGYDSKTLLPLKLVNSLFYEKSLSETIWQFVCAKKQNIISLSRESWLVSAFSIYKFQKLSNNLHSRIIKVLMNNGDKNWRNLTNVQEIVNDFQKRKMDIDDLLEKGMITERIYFEMKFSSGFNKSFDNKKLIEPFEWKELKLKELKFDSKDINYFLKNQIVKRLVFQSLTSTFEDLLVNSFEENIPIFSNEFNADSDYCIRFFVGKKVGDVFELLIVSDDILFLIFAKIVYNVEEVIDYFNNL
eukprot:gene1436-12055_t